MDVQVTGPYIYYTIPIFGGINITQTTVSLLVVTLLLCAAFVFLGKDLKKRPGGRQVLIEKGVGMLRDLVISAMGEHNEKFLPLIGTIFLSSICGSLIGMTGFLRSTTAELTVPLVWAILVTLIIWYNNIKNNGLLGWLKGFTEPIFVMTPMNIISEIAQPISMAFRHFGNVAGGGVITSILYTALGVASSLVIGLLSKTIVVPVAVVVLGVLMIVWGRKTHKKAPLIFGVIFSVIGAVGMLQYSGILENVPILQLGIPAVLSVYFDVFSGFIQAFVFSLLSMVYISAACPAPEQAE
jgi:F-type H+-transporting ATPase subunit a